MTRLAVEPRGLPAMTEADFMRQVTDLAEIYGWQWVHFRPAQTARGWRTPVQGPLGKGWPDLVLIRPRDKQVLFRELKADGQKLRPEQAECLHQLRESGADADFWAPRDWDQIVEILRDGIPSDTEDRP